MGKKRVLGAIVKSIRYYIKRVVASEYVAFVFRTYIGWVFIYASLSKILDPAVFAENVALYRLMPYWGLNAVAIILPWLELICGFLLILGLRTKAAASIVAGLLFVFTVFVLINIFRGSNIDCGCFDIASEPIGWKKVAKNTMWLMMTVQVFFFDRIYLFRRNTFLKRTKKSTLCTCD